MAYAKCRLTADDAAAASQEDVETVRLSATVLPLRTIRHRGPIELWLFVAAYVAYNASRWIITGHEAIAQANTRSIVELERSLGIAVEGGIQAVFSGDAATWLLSHLYVGAQFVVLPLVLIGLYRWSRRVYRGLRNTVLMTWLLAIPIHLLYPVAPPRLEDIGLQDTVSALIPGGLTGRSTMFFNPFAAVPSLHVGFAFAVTVALVVALRGRGRLLALAWGPLVTLAVIATGNHFVVDAIAGLIVTAAGFGIATYGPSLARRLARPLRPVPVASRAAA